MADCGYRSSLSKHGLSFVHPDRLCDSALTPCTAECYFIVTVFTHHRVETGQPTTRPALSGKSTWVSSTAIRRLVESRNGALPTEATYERIRFRCAKGRTP